MAKRITRIYKYARSFTTEATETTIHYFDPADSENTLFYEWGLDSELHIGRKDWDSLGLSKPSKSTRIRVTLSTVE